MTLDNQSFAEIPFPSTATHAAGPVCHISSASVFVWLHINSVCSFELRLWSKVASEHSGYATSLLFCNLHWRWPARFVTIKIVYQSCHLARSWLNSWQYTPRRYPGIIHISLSERCSDPLIDLNSLFNHWRIMHTQLSVSGFSWHPCNPDWLDYMRGRERVTSGLLYVL